ncbi:metallophosphoesterase [Paracoccus versutus]
MRRTVPPPGRSDMHWFTADPHYSHDRIIGFCDRPFPDVAAMNARLLAECRARVQPDDDLWILGDFTAGRSTDAQRREVRTIFHALPGRRRLIRGNHDEDWVRDLPWDSVAETADIVVDKRRLFLCHYPMITWPGARHQGLQLFGHVHQNWRGSRNSVNVGVDVWNFRPVTLPEILRRAAKLPVNAHWDQVEPGRTWPTVLCAGCGRILDPALVSGQAVVRNGRIVVAATNETIVIIGEAMRKWLPEGRHVCPECIGGYLSVSEVTLPAGFAFDEMRNRAVRKGK